MALVTGAAIAVQALANSRLRLALGTPVWAAIAQFVVGLVLARRGRVRHASAGADCWAASGRMPAWALGRRHRRRALHRRQHRADAAARHRVSRSRTITVGQLIAALALDHYGWLGSPVIRLSLPRVLGAACLLLGIFLMRWK